jgi:hypothetical protein
MLPKDISLGWSVLITLDEQSESLSVPRTESEGAAPRKLLWPRGDRDIIVKLSGAAMEPSQPRQSGNADAARPSYPEEDRDARGGDPPKVAKTTSGFEDT